MTQLGTAYETLSDEKRRTIYDATLRSSQTPTQPPQPASYPHHRSHDRDWQARREDTSYWSGPTFAHGAPDHNSWGKQRDQEQKDGFGMHEGRHRERTAHREARKEAERKKRDINRPPPAQDSFDQDEKVFKDRVEKLRKREEARAKAEREAREDDINWGKPPTPQKAYSERWYKTEEEIEKEYQERLEKEEERADRRKAKKEQSEKQWSAELLILLSKIISAEVDIDETEAKVDESKRATKGEREDEDHEQIFHLQIKRRSLERRLQKRVDEYKLIVKLLRDLGREQEADEADVKLREVCTFKSDPFRFGTSI